MILRLITKILFSRVNGYKPIFCLLLGSLTIFTLFLCSCSDSSRGEGTFENPYTIRWYTIGTPQKDLPMVQAKANEYLRKKLGVELDITMIDWANYNEKMNVIIVSGGDYDLCFTCSWSNSYVNNAMIGSLYPLNDLLDKYGQGIKKVLNPAFLEGPKINGELYAIPTNKEVAQQVVYRFNAKFLKELGYSLSDFKHNAGIESLKSIAPFMQTVKEKMADKAIIPFDVWGNNRFILHDQNYLYKDSGMPGAVTIKEGNYKVINQFKTKEMREYFDLYHEFYKKGYIPGDAAVVPDNMSIITAERFGVNWAQYQPFADVVWSLGAGYKIVSFPAFEPIITNSSVQGAMVGISINAKRPDLDMKFLNLLNTDVYLRNLLNYGIEGYHFKKTAPNRIKFLPAHSNYLVPYYTFGNLFITYLLPGDPDDKWEQFKKWNASAITSQVLGFHFDITPVQTEFGALVNVAKQYGNNLFTGSVDPAVYLPLQQKAFEAAGLETYLTEMQKQLNEWVVKNKKNKQKSSHKSKIVKK